MYVNVETGSTCSDLVFSLSADASVQRSWAIKITQYSCDYINKAPEGCLQWFFGSTTGTIQSFNWANKQHLADQNQAICVRREANQCQICFTESNAGDFQVYYLNRKLSTQNSSSESQWNVTIYSLYFQISGMDAGSDKANIICGYGTAGMGTDYDHLIIPGTRNS